MLAVAAYGARSVALLGFAPDSLIEIGASVVVLWELSASGRERRRRALRLIGAAFAVLATYLTVQSTRALVACPDPMSPPIGIAWTAVTMLVLAALPADKTRTGAALDNQCYAPKVASRWSMPRMAPQLCCGPGAICAR